MGLFFSKKIRQAYRGVKIPPKTHIALISPKIGVHVRIDLGDVKMLFVF